MSRKASQNAQPVKPVRQMGYNSRRPHRVPLLSAKNRKLRFFWQPSGLQWAQAHQNWTVEDWKNVAWSNESRFLLRHTDVRIRICRQQHEVIMDPTCLVVTSVATVNRLVVGGVMVWGMFSWHTLGPLIPINHRLNATAYLSIVADHVHSSMATIYQSANG